MQQQQIRTHYQKYHRLQITIRYTWKHTNMNANTSLLQWWIQAFAHRTKTGISHKYRKQEQFVFDITCSLNTDSITLLFYEYVN